MLGQLFHVKPSGISAVTGISLLSPDAFAALLLPHQRIVGNAKAMLPEAVAEYYIDGATLPEAAAFVAAELSVADTAALVPLYIRAPDAKLPVKG